MVFVLSKLAKSFYMSCLKLLNINLVKIIVLKNFVYTLCFRCVQISFYTGSVKCKNKLFSLKVQFLVVEIIFSKKGYVNKQSSILVIKVMANVNSQNGKLFCLYSERGKVFCNSLHVALRKSFTPNIRQVLLQQKGILFYFYICFPQTTSE